MIITGGNEVEFCNHHRYHWYLRHTSSAGAHLKWSGGGDTKQSLHTT